MLEQQDRYFCRHVRPKRKCLIEIKKTVIFSPPVLFPFWFHRTFAVVAEQNGKGSNSAKSHICSSRAKQKDRAGTLIRKFTLANKCWHRFSGDVFASELTSHVTEPRLIVWSLHRELRLVLDLGNFRASPDGSHPEIGKLGRWHQSEVQRLVVAALVNLVQC